MGAVRKYLLYAVGEILLVMIGILLALQVNNWNEERKANIKGIELIISLNKELEKNAQTIKIDLDKNKSYSSLYKIWIYEERTAKSDEKKIETIWNATNFATVDLTFAIISDILNSEGNRLIQYKQLIDELRELNNWYIGIVKHQTHLTDFYNGQFMDFVARNGHGVSFTALSPQDVGENFLELYDDQSFKSYTSAIHSLRRSVINKQQSALESIQSVLFLIQNMNL